MSEDVKLIELKEHIKLWAARLGESFSDFIEAAPYMAVEVEKLDSNHILSFHPMGIVTYRWLKYLFELLEGQLDFNIIMGNCCPWDGYYKNFMLKCADNHKVCGSKIYGKMSFWAPKHLKC